MERQAILVDPLFEGLNPQQTVAFANFVEALPYMYMPSSDPIESAQRQEEHYQAAQACMDLGLTQRLVEHKQMFEQHLAQMEASAGI